MARTLLLSSVDDNVVRRSRSGPIVLLNGAFGVGKTTVAHLLLQRDQRLRIFDPERIGFVLRRLPTWVPGNTRHLDDYQESPSWRRLTVAIARWRARPGRVLLVPMTLVSDDIIRTIRSLRDGRRWLEICLTAPDEVIARRLAKRGVSPESPEGRWVYPRSRAAAAAHRLGGFGITLDTQFIDAGEVARLALVYIRPLLDAGPDVAPTSTRDHHCAEEET